jgi:hypothetical protein
MPTNSKIGHKCLWSRVASVVAIFATTLNAVDKFDNTVIVLA